MPTPFSAARTVARRRGTVTSKELENAGIARAQVSRLVAAGDLVRIARGLYALPGRHPDAMEGLTIVAKRAPHVIFCLLTALRLHELTTQAPFEAWVAIGNKARAPRLEWPPLRVVRFSGEALGAGVERRVIGGTSVRLTSVAKTIADCFKFRQTVGLDVAREALKEALRDRRTTIDELWRYAGICRVTRIMRPYLEALA